MQNNLGILLFSLFFVSAYASTEEDERLFVGFGYGSSSAEIINFPSSGVQTPCKSEIPKYPLGEVYGPVGLVVDGNIVICGGDADLVWSSQCFALVLQEATGLLAWEEFPGMEHERAYATSVLLKDGSWMILMGEGSYGAMTYTTEIFNISTKSWSAGPEFMIHQSGYCAIALNDSHVFLVGGWWQEEQCFIFNLEDETFQEVPCLQSGGRRHHSCTRTADGRVAVAGGCHPTLPYGCTDKPDTYTAELEYYDPATNSRSYGTPLYQPVVGASLVADGGWR